MSKGTIQPNGIIGIKTTFALQDKTQKNTDGYVPLSWEKFHIERASWSKFTIQTLDSLFDNSLCEDMTRFRSNYNSLNRQQKVNVWAELISSICKFESAWKLNSWMEEDMGIDPVTKKKVRSEGLLQLSYQDKPNYADLPCRFDWNLDKNLNENDQIRQYLTLKLAKQIRNRKKNRFD